jgi:[histone H3]-lysine9 N-trimethyltransferase SUV39H
VKDDKSGEYIEKRVHAFDVDGELVGGPVRFINHSCEPNCRQFVVSWNRHDRERYNLAFFALEDISADTELTFDYMDSDDGDDLQVAEIDDGLVPCLCGTPSCRKWLWR